MKSGKSLLLLREAEKLHFSKLSYVVVRPPEDTRDFVSRSFSPKIKLNIKTYYEDVFDDYKYLVFDELHLFNSSIIKRLIECDNDIICAGLSSGIHEGRIQVLPNIREILAYSDSIIKLTAVCEECGCFDGNFSIPNGDVVDISDNYTVLCKKCLERYKNRVVSTKLLYAEAS